MCSGKVFIETILFWFWFFKNILRPFKPFFTNTLAFNIPLLQAGLDIGCTRCNFSVLDWNAPSIDFYKRQGAVDLSGAEGWLSFRMNHQEMKNFCSSNSSWSSKNHKQWMFVSNFSIHVYSFVVSFDNTTQYFLWYSTFVMIWIIFIS